MPRSRPPEQLDIPLVWELDRPPLEPAAGDPFPVPPDRDVVSTWPLLGAAVADLGACLLAMAVTAAVAATAGAALRPAQLGVAVLAGLAVISWVAVGCLWVWGATPGLALFGAGAERALALGRSVGFWLAWVVALPLLGVPLLVGRRGMRGAERLLGSRLSSR